MVTVVTIITKVTAISVAEDSEVTTATKKCHLQGEICVICAQSVKICVKNSLLSNPIEDFLTQIFTILWPRFDWAQIPQISSAKQKVPQQNLPAEPRKKVPFICGSKPSPTAPLICPQ